MRDVTRIEDGASNIEYVYDAADRLVRETQRSGAAQHVIDYGYDTLDRRTKRTVDGSDVTAYTWDKAGRLTAIGYAGQTTSYEYDAAGRLTKKTLPNGIVQTNAYDGAGRLLSIAYSNAGGVPIETIAYAYDANGQRTSKTTGSASVPEAPFTATYDAANRLTGLVLKGTGAGGADEPCSLSYDSNGSLLTKTCGANITTYTWDAQERLTQIAGPGVTASFAYDVLGRRIGKTVNGTTTTFVYDGIQAIGEMRGGEPTALLTGVGIDEAIARYTSAGNRTQLTDALGSVIAEARDDGSIATRYAYTPYGLVMQSGEPSANSTQYTGRENDATGLLYYRARYYDPLIKRFVSEDPIGLAGGINPYSYVGGNPLGFSDPMGLDA